MQETVNKTKLKPNSVPIYVRYQYACAELNTRLSSRQTVTIAFTTISWAVLALTFTIDITKNSLGSWLGLLIPIICLSYSLWLCHNDITIGLLSKFCSEYEKWGEEDLHDKNLLGIYQIKVL